jgi:hypothetical protein
VAAKVLLFEQRQQGGNKMIQFRMKMVVTLPKGWLYNGETTKQTGDVRIWTIEKDTYDVDLINSLIKDALENVRIILGVTDNTDLKQFNPEIGIYLSADKGDCRPSMHLTSQTLSLLAAAGADFDFDPYVEF